MKRPNVVHTVASMRPVERCGRHGQGQVPRGERSGV